MTQNICLGAFCLNVFRTLEHKIHKYRPTFCFNVALIWFQSFFKIFTNCFFPIAIAAQLQCSFNKHTLKASPANEAVVTRRGLAGQCCQLAEISAAKHKSGPLKISAAGRNCGRMFGRFLKKWQKSGQTFIVCVLHIKAFII
jgi:hypothetical protein